MTKSQLMRIPEPDASEIRKIANEYKMNIQSAYQLWKKRKLGIKWEEY